MSYIYFVRHGQTNNNKNIISKSNDVPLNNMGINEAKYTGLYLRKFEPFDLILCSPKLRTKQTAYYILEYFNNKPQIIYDPRLKENPIYNYLDGNDKKMNNLSKEITGTTINEIKEKYKNDQITRYYASMELYNKLDKYTNKFPHTETLKEFYEINKSFIDDLKGKYKNKKILVICHFGTIVTLMNIMFNIYTLDFWMFAKKLYGLCNCVIGLVYYGNKIAYYDNVGKDNFMLLTKFNNNHLADLYKENNVVIYLIILIIFIIILLIIKGI